MILKISLCKIYILKKQQSNLFMYSRHFLLPSNTLKPKHINECMPMIGARFYAQIDNLHVRGDILENELAKVS
jgi:hypothetical protein